VNKPVVFPFGEVWWFYLAFVGFIVGLLVLDLKVFHRKLHTPSMREAGLWSIFWVGLALSFNLGLWLVLRGVVDAGTASDLAQKFLTGYLIELSLSVDNLFVFVVIFSYFAIPGEVQHRVLFFGILGAIVFRAIFIAAGALLMQFTWVVIAMGLFLIYTGIKLCIPHDEKIDPEKNPMIRLFRRFVPVTPTFQGARFFVVEGGRRLATPLLVALLVVEMTDIVFALDSVPAIFSITNETLIVFTSNMFAILGLRTLYFLLAGAVGKFHYLKYGLGVILLFVGVKMSVLHYLHVDVPTTLSLGIVLGVLVVSIAMSFLIPRKPDAPIHESPAEDG
jgi:tellurite resistance protein TerC